MTVDLSDFLMKTVSVKLRNSRVTPVGVIAYNENLHIYQYEIHYIGGTLEGSYDVYTINGKFLDDDTESPFDIVEVKVLK